MRDLCASIGASIIDDPDQVTIGSSIADVSATANVAVSLGLIVTELVINALKHAFPGRLQQGRIEVDYLRSDDAWTIRSMTMGSAWEPKPMLSLALALVLSRL